MAQRLNKLYTFVLLAFFIVNISNPFVAAYSDNFQLDETEFEDAWYADLDKDGFEDDIRFKIEIELECKEYHSYDNVYNENGIIIESDDYYDYERYSDDDEDDYIEYGCSEKDLKKYGVVYYLKIQLILPSGYEYTHYLKRIAYEDDFVLELNLINHATEPGWYWGHVTGLNQDLEPITETDSIYFDPPGGGGGGTPIVT